MSEQSLPISRQHLLRREPNSMTLSDLVALVAGVAFALLLEATVGATWFAYVGVTGLEATLIKSGDYVSKLTIALIAVLVVRHIRSTEEFRAAEWLIITNAMWSVHWRLVRAGGMQWIARCFGWPHLANTDLGDFAGLHRLWYTVGIVCLLTVVMALTALRMPNKVRPSLLVMLPLFALWGPCFLFSGELQLLMSGRWPSVSYVRLMMMAYVGLMRLPEHVLVCLPLAATLKDLMREDRPTWTWVEQAGLCAVLVTAMTDGIRIMAETTRNTPLVPEGLAHLSIEAVWWLAAFAVACIAVRGLGGLWKSWSEQQSL
jgi:hypothetical protein